MESVTRLIPGVLEKEEASLIESFSKNTVEYPQFTRPEDYKDMKVPEVLLSGNHKEIEAWRKENSIIVQREIQGL
jgi:tRNA (guanine37-N1)-methyltransferase